MADELTEVQQRAKELVEYGEPIAKIAVLLGVGERSVHRWKADFGWQRQVFLEDPVRREAAKLETRTRMEWAERRREEANGAGMGAATLRNELLKAAKKGDSPLVRSLSIAYGILIDKAEVITRTVEGGVTPVASATKDERLGRISGITDQLAARRQKKLEQTQSPAEADEADTEAV